MNKYLTFARVLIIGGTGFLCSRLCNRLTSEGVDIIGLVNFFIGTKENVGHFLGKPLFELMRNEVNFLLYIDADKVCPIAAQSQLAVSFEAPQYNNSVIPS